MNNLFSLSGRSGIKRFWIDIFLFFIPSFISYQVIFYFFLERLHSVVRNVPLFSSYKLLILLAVGSGDLVVYIYLSVLFLFYLLFMIIWFTICVKRLHDRDKSGWWVLVSIIPFIGILWLLFECGFLKGTTGPNRFGPDPVEVSSNSENIQPVVTSIPVSN